VCIAILLLGFSLNRTDSTESTASTRISEIDLWLPHRTILLRWTQRICRRTRPAIGALLVLQIFNTAGV
jgi:hypothetical protein